MKNSTHMLLRAITLMLLMILMAINIIFFIGDGDKADSVKSPTELINKEHDDV